MGFFDKLLVGLGFEANDSTETQSKPQKLKKEKQKKSKTPQREYGVSFNLYNKQKEDEIQKEEKAVNLAEEEIKSRAEKSGFAIEIPKSQQEIQLIIDKVASNKTVIVNVSGFNATDRIRALDFLAGAIYTLRGKIQPLEGNLYILYPNQNN